METLKPYRRWCILNNAHHTQELCTSPKLVVDGVSPHDLNQGHLGNCWFIAACTSLSLDQEAWHRVVPDVNQQVSVLYIILFIAIFGKLTI